MTTENSNKGPIRLEIVWIVTSVLLGLTLLGQGIFLGLKMVAISLSGCV